MAKEDFKYEYNSNSCGSIRDYFVAQSQGKFKPNFKLLGKVKVNKRGMVITADQQEIDDNAKPSNLFGNGVNAISGLKVVFPSR
ncbi:MAG: hypothetical protein IJK50_12520 [Prevotella sp.]|nr:hypothetical protein [Prevotella sp.]